ncbi:hypothetical protein [Jiulongibacter sediminis]|uniref:Sulfotransferase domain-containing protein n=1 Tax=Jiulongibacter sediminis TaxID=1605367 RepID=A0A0P7BRB4_9BACT|nr:hypothetical protein [Jiulongibacter sediminis]KPM49806.1 hypothetical protein AFM12_04325 [Jiulongibacter sediminis]TBX26843.1 hypothetical protein TK44_04330 [Jiulongibacter sediminis]
MMIPYMIEYGVPRETPADLQEKLLTTDFSDTEIYFHVGVERTGTKYLQKSIFPSYKKLHFINKDRYPEAKEIILKKEHKRYLVSMELNLNSHFEVEVNDFLSAFPQARIIMVMRPLSGWLVSHYKRIVKNGFNIRFDELWNQNGESVFDPEEIKYRPKIEFLESKTQYPPLYLIHGDLRKNPLEFLKKLADYVGEEFDESTVSLKPVHTSYNDRQLKALRWVMKYVNISRSKPYSSDLRNRFYRLRVDTIRYVVMYLAKIVPDSFFSNQPLISKKEKEEVADFYQEDWQAVLDFLEK